MKKIFHYSILLCTLALALAGCKQEPVVFDHEQSMFPLNENAVLIEAIVPVGTSSTDEIYITGPFCDYQPIQMQKAAQSDIKWGVYIFASDCKNGKTLADGFTFISKNEGQERNLMGDTVLHTLNAMVGTTNNVWIDRWESYFGGSTIRHDGYVIYIDNQTGWEDVYMYGYADGSPEIFGGWPGVKVNGLETINGVEYRYIDCGKDNNDLTYNMIFNNGNSGGDNQFNGPSLLLNKNYFIRLKEDLSYELFEPDAAPAGHDGAVLYILDGLEWGKNITCYMWGDVNDLSKDGGATAGWPGRAIDGVEQVGDHEWYYIDLGAACEGKSENLIFSKNGNTQFDGPQDYVIGKENLYVYLSPNKEAIVVEDPMNIDPTWTIYEATEKEKEKAVIDLYVYDATSMAFHTQSNLTDSAVVLTDTTATNIYAWGSKECFGAWPGSAVQNWESQDILGIHLSHYRIECYVGDYFNLIVNNKDADKGGAYQYDAMMIEAAQTETTYYLKVGDRETKPLELSVLSPRRRH